MGEDAVTRCRERNKVYKEGAILVVMTHMCQAFEDLCRGGKDRIAAWRGPVWLPVLGLRPCVISPMFPRAVLTPRRLCSHSHSPALPFIELLLKEAAGLMSQDLYAFLREERQRKGERANIILLNFCVRLPLFQFDLVFIYIVYAPWKAPLKLFSLPEYMESPSVPLEPAEYQERDAQGGGEINQGSTLAGVGL